MLVKILGIVDLLMAVALFMVSIKIAVPSWILVIIIVVLAVKSLPFVMKFDIASIMDLVVAIIVLLSLFISMPSLIILIASLVLAQKGIFSLV